MDEQQALQEARRRWGEHAVVAFDETTCLSLCLVGVQTPDALEPEWLGVGRTWKLAFAEVDSKPRSQT